MHGSESLRFQGVIQFGGRKLAESEGFEPPVPLRVRLISSQVHSTGLCQLSYRVSLRESASAEQAAEAFHASPDPGRLLTAGLGFAIEVRSTGERTRR